MNSDERANNKVNLGIFLKKILEENMGYVLDLVKISPIGDRQFSQFERTLKTYVRKTISNSIKALSEYKEFEVNLDVLNYTPKEKQNKE